MNLKMAANTNLHKAKEAKNDEFYTQLSDVEKELVHYKEHFKDKVVFCNCDDPTWSAFWRYFHLNFAKLGLKKLVSTHYNKDIPTTNKLLLTEIEEKAFTYKMEYTGGDDNNIEAGVKTPLEGNGDFRNKECLDILDECDIVVTNPPFSLFKEFILLLMKYNKQFITIGNLNAIQNKDFFPYILSGKIWLGATCFSGGATYFVGSKDLYDPEKMSNPKNAYIKNDKLYWRVNGVRWYTNVDHPALHMLIPLDLGYVYHGHEQMYIKYENYDAINVDKVSQIPCDYTGEMGVPVSFMDKYCVDQFDIVGIGIGKLGQELGMTPMPKEIDESLPGHSSVWRLYYMKDGKPVVPFQRIIIKFKDSYIKSHPELFNKGE